MNSVSSGGCEAARTVQGFSFVSLCLVNEEIDGMPRPWLQLKGLVQVLQARMVIAGLL
jgi:hypothetical protein